MNGKDVYVLGLNFHAVSDVKVNIPNFYDYPAFHEALWEYRADRSNVEKRDKQLKLGENGLYIERWNRHYEKYEILPDSLWLEGYTDREEPSPHELIFGIISAGRVVREPLANILNQHRLGQTTLTPVQIYDYNTRALWSDEVFYFLNICEKREFVCFPQSHQDFSVLNYEMTGIRAYSMTSIIERDNQVEIHHKALDCDVDLWYDPVLSKLFISSALYDDLKGMGLKHGFYNYGTFSASIYECKLI